MNKINLPCYYSGIPEFDALRLSIYNIDLEKEDLLEKILRESSPITAKNLGLQTLAETFKCSADSIDILNHIQTSYTITKATLINIIKTLLETDADIRLIEDNDNGSVEVGVFTKLSDEEVQKRLNTLKYLIPAHIHLGFYVNKLSWSKFDEYGYSYDKWDSLNLTVDEFEVYGVEEDRR